MNTNTTRIAKAIAEFKDEATHLISGCTILLTMDYPRNSTWMNCSARVRLDNWNGKPVTIGLASGVGYDKQGEALEEALKHLGVELIGTPWEANEFYTRGAVKGWTVNIEPVYSKRGGGIQKKLVTLTRI